MSTGGVIVAEIVTDGNADDAAAASDLLEQVDGEISLFVADAAYDTRPIYRALKAGYYRQARVENAFFRYKTILRGRLRARDPAAQEVEVRVACHILNRMTELGRPESFAVGM